MADAAAIAHVEALAALLARIAHLEATPLYREMLNAAEANLSTRTYAQHGTDKRSA